MKKIVLLMLMVVAAGLAGAASVDSTAIEPLIGLDQMVKSYKLDDGQKEAVSRLNDNYRSRMTELLSNYDEQLATSEDKAQLKAARDMEQKRYNLVMQEILSEKQYEKFEVDIKAAVAARDARKMSRRGISMPGQTYIDLLGDNPIIPDTIEFVETLTKKMVKKYKLDDEQARKLQALNLAEVRAEVDERVELATIDRRNFNSDKMQELMEAAAQRTENYKNYLKEIMTEEQYKKYTNVQSAQANQQQNRGPGGFGGGRPPGR